MQIVAFVPDLIDRSRITSIEPQVVFVDSPADLPAASSGADLVLVDLSRSGALQVLTDLRCPRVVGFTNHTDKTGMAAAQGAGAVPMARSDFFVRLEELLDPAQ